MSLFSVHNGHCVASNQQWSMPTNLVRPAACHEIGRIFQCDRAAGADRPPSFSAGEIFPSMLVARAASFTRVA
jgi:hypothetical protein